jgi:DNA-3-methyladenine glycosylase I
LTGVMAGQDGVARCWWCVGDPLYQGYHDTEWGRPVADDRYLFEKICLEGFQSGLSWITILRKRENFRKAFKSFEIDAVARFNARTVSALLRDPGIVRNRAKIESTINNARKCATLVKEFGSLAAYVWSFEPPARSRPRRLDRQALLELPVSEQAKAMSKDLKRRGWSFVGPTTLYAFMEAVGMVNDHLSRCHFHDEVEQLRSAFQRPAARARRTGRSSRPAG